MSELKLAFLTGIGETLARLAQILEINGESLVRNGTRVIGIWVSPGWPIG